MLVQSLVRIVGGRFLGAMLIGCMTSTVNTHDSATMHLIKT